MLNFLLAKLFGTKHEEIKSIIEILTLTRGGKGGPSPTSSVVNTGEV